MGCASVRQTADFSGTDKCLQDIVFKPLGIDIRDTLLHNPQDIQNRFGRPDSIQKQDNAIGQTLSYFYPGKAFIFMSMQGSSCLSSLEVTKGRIGCLKIDMSKSSFEQKYGPVEDPIESRSYIDESSGIRFNLILEFKDNRLIKVTPQWDEIFGLVGRGSSVKN